MPTVTDASPLTILLGALKSLVRWFEAAKVRGVIIGGVANTFLGRPRMTRDVDGMVWLGDDSRTADFIALAGRFGIVPRIDDAVAFARANRVMLLTHPASAINIDVSSGCLPFEDELLDRSQVDSSLGFKIPLPTPEDLIVLKLLPSRPHDLSDIEGIMDAHPNLDVARVRLWAGRFAAAAEMPEIVENLERLLAARDRLHSKSDGRLPRPLVPAGRQSPEPASKATRVTKKTQTKLVAKRKTVKLTPSTVVNPLSRKRGTVKKTSTKKKVAPPTKKKPRQV